MLFSEAIYFLLKSIKLIEMHFAANKQQISLPCICRSLASIRPYTASQRLIQRGLGISRRVRGSLT